MYNHNNKKTETAAKPREADGSHFENGLNEAKMLLFFFFPAFALLNFWFN